MFSKELITRIHSEVRLNLNPVISTIDMEDISLAPGDQKKIDLRMEKKSLD